MMLTMALNLIKGQFTPSKKTKNIHVPLRCSPAITVHIVLVFFCNVAGPVLDYNETRCTNKTFGNLSSHVSFQKS